MVTKKTSSAKLSSSKKKKKGSSAHQSTFLDIKDVLGSQADIVSSILRLSDVLAQSPLFARAIQTLEQRKRSFTSLVGLGLGQFSSSQSALIQVAFLLALYHYLSTGQEVEVEPGLDGHGHSATSDCDHSITVTVFDPMFSPLEREVCAQLGFQVTSENLRGKHTVPTEGSSIFYMPHCPYSLYSNLLWKNCNSLPQLTIIGNRYDIYSIISILISILISICIYFFLYPHQLMFSLRF